MRTDQFVQAAGLRKNTGPAQAVVIKGSRTRLSQCHSFGWSRELWYRASKEIVAVTSLLLVTYLALASWGMYQDGLRGIDIPYFLACTLTTVGFGDLSPQSQHARLAAVFFLPFGLIVISFGVANFQAYAMSKASEASKRMQSGLFGADDSPTPKNEKPEPGSWRSVWIRFNRFMVAQIFMLLRNYVFIIIVGAAFFYFNERERRLQEQRRDVDLTLVDAFYLATVTASAVGYGHSIWPITSGTKLFMVFYFFASTGIIGVAVRNIANLYVERKREEINAKLIDSTVWVHKADLHHNKVIFQADYVLFKLQQMMAVDVDILNRLTKRFEELDVDYSRLLQVGDAVPSAEMVSEMQEIMNKTGESLQSQWNKRRKEVLKEQKQKSQLGLLESALGGGDRPIKLSACHDFAWSRTLWRNASAEAGRNIFILLCAYLFLGFWLMAYYDPSIANGNWLIVDGWYFLFATMTTVGLGDYAPETQLSRGFAIVMIPSGMVVLSMVLAGISMYNKSLTPTLKADPGFNRSAEAHKLFEAIDVNNDGVLSRDEVMGKSFECLGISPEEACDLFDSLDLDKSGTLELNKIEENGLSFEWNSVPMRFLFLFLKLYCTIALGAVFFKLHGQFGAADNLSWVDCFYWATVVSTSVGYGDITPSTYEGKLFLTFYMVFSTVITAQVLGSMISLYVNDVVAERIVAKLIDSTIWVHKVDISDPSDKKNYGQITESDFVLFKLIQMQKVDEKVLERLIDRFFELDPDGSGSLSIGVEIPNKEQVVEMKTIIEGTGMTLQEAWRKHLSNAFRLRTEVIEDPGSGSSNDHAANQSRQAHLDMEFDPKGKDLLGAEVGQKGKANLDAELDQKRREHLVNFMSEDGLASRGVSPEPSLPRFILGKGSRI